MRGGLLLLFIVPRRLVMFGIPHDALLGDLAGLTLTEQSEFAKRLMNDVVSTVQLVT